MAGWWRSPFSGHHAQVVCGHRKKNDARRRVNVGDVLAVRVVLRSVVGLELETDRQTGFTRTNKTHGHRET